MSSNSSHAHGHAGLLTPWLIRPRAHARASACAWPQQWASSIDACCCLAMRRRLLLSRLRTSKCTTVSLIDSASWKNVFASRPLKMWFWEYLGGGKRTHARDSAWKSLFPHHNNRLWLWCGKKWFSRGIPRVRPFFSSRILSESHF
jgi:hypothetical protein